MQTLSKFASSNLRQNVGVCKSQVLLLVRIYVKLLKSIYQSTSTLKFVLPRCSFDGSLLDCGQSPSKKLPAVAYTGIPVRPDNTQVIPGTRYTIRGAGHCLTQSVTIVLEVKIKSVYRVEAVHWPSTSWWGGRVGGVVGGKRTPGFPIAFIIIGVVNCIQWSRG